MNKKQNALATLVFVVTCVVAYVLLPKINYQPHGQAFMWVPSSTPVKPEAVNPDSVKVFDHLALGWHPVGEVNVKYSVFAKDPYAQDAIFKTARELVASKGGKGFIVQAYLTFRDVIHFRAVIVSP